MTRRLQVLFLLALLGVVVLLGLVAHALLGGTGAAVYAAVAVGLLAVGSARARARAAARRSAGHTCTCCAGTVHDPVQVRAGAGVPGAGGGSGG